jgi:hypothetical protein
MKILQEVEKHIKVDAEIERFFMKNAKHEPLKKANF